MPSRFRRWACRLLGHRMVLDDRGTPVTSFNVCVRCGWFTR